jgi:hypothetical protein
MSGYALSITSPQLYYITFYNIEEQDFFPTRQMLEFIPTTQRIKLYNQEDEQIYGILYKNNAATDMKQLLGAQDYSDTDVGTFDSVNAGENVAPTKINADRNVVYANRDMAGADDANIDEAYSSDEE